MLPEFDSKGPKSQTVGPKHDADGHGDASGTSSKSKVPILAIYVRRHHAIEHIIGDKIESIMTRNKLKGTCLLAEFEPRMLKMLWIMKVGLK